MTADAALMAVTKRADRVRLERERELDELARLMRQPGGLAEAPEPPPLHRAGRNGIKFSTETITKVTATERTTSS
jgi:hypothetical protein